MTTISSFARTATRLSFLAALGAWAACSHGGATPTTTAPAQATSAGMAQPDAANPMPPSASAQGSRHFMPPPITNDAIDARVTELRQRLALDAAQETEVRHILAESHARYEILREQAEAAGGVHDPALREQFVQLHFDTEDRIYGVLRCDQKDQLRILEREERMARIEHYRAMRRRGSESATTRTEEMPLP